MARRQYRHSRNRQPRPSLVESPAAPITIVRASTFPTPDNLVFLQLSSAVAVQVVSTPSLRDATEGADSISIASGSPRPYEIAVTFAAFRNRIGDSVGWLTPPPELVALGISLAPSSFAVCDNVNEG